MPITNPTLPAVAGYVEVDVGGVRKYRDVETGEIIDGTPKKKVDKTEQLRADVDYIAVMTGVIL